MLAGYWSDAGEHPGIYNAQVLSRRSDGNVCQFSVSEPNKPAYPLQRETSAFQAARRVMAVPDKVENLMPTGISHPYMV